MRNLFPILSQDAPTAERVVKYVDASLRSTHLPSKVCALYGCLYLLEGGMSDIVHQIIPLLTDLLTRQLASITS